jgi:hypothetical protein
MTTSNHIYAGAIIALTVKDPAVALPLALLSHFVLDALPHYGHENYTEALKHRLTYVMESVNLIGIPLLVYLLWGQSVWVWLAAIVALSPDLAWVYRYTRYERRGRLPRDGLLTRFHKGIQRYEVHWGIYVEYMFFILFVCVLYRLVT